MDILCTTDLTPASDAALRTAVSIARRAGSAVTLLHVLPERAGPAEEARVTALMDHTIAAQKAAGLCRVLILHGPFMERIAEESANHDLVVMGTHGPRGIRQKLFGADILKLVRQLAVPALVVQEHSPADRTLEHMVMPVAAHTDVDRLVEMVCALARLHGSEVHVYQLLRPNEDPSEDLLRNKQAMLDLLRREGIRYQLVEEPVTAFSIGFALATIAYAERIGAGLIAIMAHASDEYRYIADAEKERMLTNEPGVPVLCA
jgi:nucleotide-binding universal stress UspA family protein